MKLFIRKKKRFYYDPKEDITLYELAKITPLFTADADDFNICVECLDEPFKRHFKEFL